MPGLLVEQWSTPKFVYILLCCIFVVLCFQTAALRAINMVAQYSNILTDYPEINPCAGSLCGMSSAHTMALYSNQQE